MFYQLLSCLSLVSNYTDYLTTISLTPKWSDTCAYKKKKPGKLELLIFGDGDGKGIPISSP